MHYTIQISVFNDLSMKNTEIYLNNSRWQECLFTVFLLSYSDDTKFLEFCLNYVAFDTVLISIKTNNSSEKFCKVTSSCNRSTILMTDITN